MNENAKSIAYAFIANGVQIYLDDKEDQFLISRLVCAECGGPWYMNLTECFLCGAINEFLYRCANCGEFISITNSSLKCTKCGSNELYMTCPNEDCISNKDSELSQEINKHGGVFNKESGFRISQQYCLYCGSQLHMYKNYRIKVYTASSDIIPIDKIIDNTTENDSNLYLLVKRKKESKIFYGIYKTSKVKEENLILDNLHDNISKIVDFLYPIRIEKKNDEIS